MARALGLMSGAAAVLLLVGCGGDGVDTEGSSSTSSSTTSSTTSTSPTSAEPSTPAPTADQSTSTGAVVAFIETSDELAGSFTSDLTDLSTVSRGEARKDEAERLRIYRSRQWRSTGSTGLHDLRETSSSKDRAKVSVCIDYSDVDVLDAEGTSVVNDDRQERVLHQYTVVHDEQADAWFVSALKDGGPTC